MDAILKLAQGQLVLLAADLQVQLEKHTSLRPTLYLLAKQREKAANAIVAFIDIDPTDAKVIAKLQQEIALYDDLITHCRELVARGREADDEMTEEVRAELEQLIMQMSDEERRLYRLEPRGSD